MFRKVTSLGERIRISMEMKSPDSQISGVYICGSFQLRSTKGATIILWRNITQTNAQFEEDNPKEFEEDLAAAEMPSPSLSTSSNSNTCQGTDPTFEKYSRYLSLTLEASSLKLPPKRRNVELLNSRLASVPKSPTVMLDSKQHSKSSNSEDSIPLYGKNSLLQIVTNSGGNHSLSWHIKLNFGHCLQHFTATYNIYHSFGRVPTQCYAIVTVFYRMNKMGMDHFILGFWIKLRFMAHFSLVQSECRDALLTHWISLDPLANLGFQVPASLAGFYCEQISIDSNSILLINGALVKCKFTVLDSMAPNVNTLHQAPLAFYNLGADTTFGVSVKNNCYLITVMLLDVRYVGGVNITKGPLLWPYYAMNKKASIKNKVQVVSATNWSLWNCIKYIIKRCFLCLSHKATAIK
uniref:Uncharacterized protein n=1 Tax=Timema monikensis TaxID=170555 RepID=A0A7R9EFY4_9NEOP|nr:unnamed protein product [Timema monikensis]